MMQKLIDKIELKPLIEKDRKNKQLKPPQLTSNMESFKNEFWGISRKRVTLDIEIMWQAHLKKNILNAHQRKKPGRVIKKMTKECLQNFHGFLICFLETMHMEFALVLGWDWKLSDTIHKIHYFEFLRYQNWVQTQFCLYKYRRSIFSFFYVIGALKIKAANKLHKETIIFKKSPDKALIFYSTSLLKQTFAEFDLKSQRGNFYKFIEDLNLGMFGFDSAIKVMRYKNQRGIAFRKAFWDPFFFVIARTMLQIHSSNHVCKF